ncbi:MAG: hypothetical protein ACKVP5_11320 [Aestuariivirga sp.]
MPSKFHLALLIALLSLSRGTLAAECDLAAISEALDAPLVAMKATEVEVAEVQSTEGGVWEIYREKDGRLNTVIRIDAGEMGRSDTRLSVVDRAAWGISSTISEYNRHAFAEGGGPLAVVKKITVYYFFCGGKLHTPPPEWSTTGDEYAAAAGGAKDTFFKAPEIAEFIKGLVR